MVHFMNTTLSVPLIWVFFLPVLLFKDDRTEYLTESIYERMLPSCTKLHFHCPKIIIHFLSLLYVVASSFHKYATALTVYWIPIYAVVTHTHTHTHIYIYICIYIYIRVGFLVLQYHLTCLCSLITLKVYFCTALRLLNCTEQVTSNEVTDSGCGDAYFSTGSGRNT